MIEDILPIVVGGLLTLAGALIGPYFQRKHEHWRAAREDAQLIREKAAELFMELDRIVAESHQATMAAIKNLTDENAVSSPLPDLGKVRLLVAVYFPEAKPLVESYEEKNLELTRRLASKIRKATEEKNANAFKVITAMIVQERSQHSYDFVRDVRSEVSNKVPRLK